MPGMCYIGTKIETENATVPPRGRYNENRSCLNEEKENTGIRCSEPREQFLLSGIR